MGASKRYDHVLAGWLSLKARLEPQPIWTKPLPKSKQNLLISIYTHRYISTSTNSKQTKQFLFCIFRFVHSCWISNSVDYLPPYSANQILLKKSLSDWRKKFIALVWRRYLLGLIVCFSIMVCLSEKFLRSPWICYFSCVFVIFNI